MLKVHVLFYPIAPMRTGPARKTRSTEFVEATTRRGIVYPNPVAKTPQQPNPWQIALGSDVVSHPSNMICCRSTPKAGIS